MVMVVSVPAIVSVVAIVVVPSVVPEEVGVEEGLLILAVAVVSNSNSLITSFIFFINSSLVSSLRLVVVGSIII